MANKSTATSRSYCSQCGWMDAGDEHDWEKHPESVHGFE